MADEVEKLRAIGYDCYEWRHAVAILQADFPEEWNDIYEILSRFRINRKVFTDSGGGKTSLAQEFDSAFTARGWVEKQFKTEIKVDDTTHQTPTHKVDCVKGRVALELEWSNKDPFFDRDLNNFRLLFELRAISVGIIITKADSLRPLMVDLGVWNKYGTSTTWIHKLLPRIEGGGGGGCPLLVLGFTDKLVVDDE